MLTTFLKYSDQDLHIQANLRKCDQFIDIEDLPALMRRVLNENIFKKGVSWVINSDEAIHRINLLIGAFEQACNLDLIFQGRWHNFCRFPWGAGLDSSQGYSCYLCFIGIFQIWSKKAKQNYFNKIIIEWLWNLFKGFGHKQKPVYKRSIIDGNSNGPTLRRRNHQTSPNGCGARIIWTTEAGEKNEPKGQNNLFRRNSLPSRSSGFIEIRIDNLSRAAIPDEIDDETVREWHIESVF